MAWHVLNTCQTYGQIESRHRRLCLQRPYESHCASRPHLAVGALIICHHESISSIPLMVTVQGNGVSKQPVSCCTIQAAQCYRQHVMTCAPAMLFQLSWKYSLLCSCRPRHEWTLSCTGHLQPCGEMYKLCNPEGRQTLHSSWQACSTIIVFAVIAQ